MKLTGPQIKVLKLSRAYSPGGCSCLDQRPAMALVKRGMLDCLETRGGRSRWLSKRMGCEPGKWRVNSHQMDFYITQEGIAALDALEASK